MLRKGGCLLRLAGQIAPMSVRPVASSSGDAFANPHHPLSYSSKTTQLLPSATCTNTVAIAPIQHRTLSTTAHAMTDDTKTLLEFGGLKLTRVTKEDVDDVTELLVNDFIKNEPHCNALGMTEEEGRWLIKELTPAVIDTPVSYAFRAPDGSIAAARLCNVLQRPTGTHEGQFAALENHKPEMSRNVYEVVRIVNELESKIWELVDPGVKSLLNVVILSCHRNWTRRGLVSKLIEFDLEEQRRMGIDGAISEATAYNSQHLFAKYGYTPIYEIKHDTWLDDKGQRIFKCHDKTTSAQLVYNKY